jgi:hypothetical protein
VNLFKKKKEVRETKDSLYKKFKEGIDPLSKKRLESIDMSLALEASRFKAIGFTLTEFGCANENVILKRNQLGYYALEIYSLNSKKEFEYYQYGLNLIDEYKDEFKKINELYTEKETIMNGLYNAVADRKDLETISKKLGYGETLERTIYEAEPKHPSKEYGEIVKYLRIASVGNKRELNLLLNKCFNALSKHFVNGVRLEPKMIGIKYKDYEETKSYGVFLIDEKMNETKLIYEIFNGEITKQKYSNYLIDDNPYLDIYMRIISKAIKRISVIEK